ncbi:MAG: AMP-dependent synthetase [Candidatus Rokubacteria bacterium 13_1_40CM_4_67_11]|nr:MAG: AMP-dependent synthetase [Candidatus Rokubacteria bacterium 13_1_40CM_4_67_11]
MHIDFLLDAFRADVVKDAVVWQDEPFSYAWLLVAVGRWADFLRNRALAPGTVVSLEADFSPTSIALLLALVEHGAIIVPLTPSVEAKKPEFRDIAQVEATISIAGSDRAYLRKTGVAASHELFERLRIAGRPGLVLFSSGSTGTSKAAVHDFVPLLEKFKVPRHALRTLTFLLFDHIGGVNTLLYVLSNAGCVVTVPKRSPEVVCAAIERHRVQLLPTSPTFINLLLMSEAYKRHDLSSLEMVTYGTEVMPETTLERFHRLFPRVRLLQTYGLSEVGILRSQSRAADSLWVKVGGDGFETRVVDGMLQIRARSAMLGYLNAPSPFTSDGWLPTGDAVDVDGEYLRIRGRHSEIINVGGEKVYPAEVESVLQSMEGVKDVTVGSEPNPISGQIVTARVKLATGESLPEFRKRMRLFCRDKLPLFKIPQKVVLVDEAMHGERFKKMRRVS